MPSNKFAFLVDADFVFPADLMGTLVSGRSGAMLQQARHRWFSAGERRVMVIPAFERASDACPSRARLHECAPSLDRVETGSACWMYTTYDVPLTKAELRRMVTVDHSVTGFYEERVRPSCPCVRSAPLCCWLACCLLSAACQQAVTCLQWPDSHGCYQPRRALDATAFYDFAYQHPCEPYVIGLKAALPAFDQRWRGRQLDKTSYITQLAAVGFQFTVNPDAFMVHLPHAAGVAMERRVEGDDGDLDLKGDLLALPYGLTRVMLEDLKLTPAFQTEVLVKVPAMSQYRVAKLLNYDLRKVKSPAQVKAERAAASATASVVASALSQASGPALSMVGVELVRTSTRWLLAHEQEPVAEDIEGWVLPQLDDQLHMRQRRGLKRIVTVGAGGFCCTPCCASLQRRQTTGMGLDWDADVAWNWQGWYAPLWAAACAVLACFLVRIRVSGRVLSSPVLRVAIKCVRSRLCTRAGGSL